MKTGLTKKQKTTAIYFDEDSPIIEVITYNTDLKNRLSAFAVQHPKECRLIDDDEQVCKTFEVKKGRFGFKLTPPYTEERRKAASELAKNHINNLKRKGNENLVV